MTPTESPETRDPHAESTETRDPHAQATETGEKPPVDPGCLPAWEVGEMPAPVPFSKTNLLALLGPSMVMIGGTIGTGEWVVGSGVAALYQGALLWVAPMAILCQVILNTEAMRYTLVTGEPVFTGFMRTKPGPRFWLIWYMLLDFLGWWPAMAGLAAQVVLFTIFRSTNMDPQMVGWTSCGVLVVCGLLLCFGGKIYNTLEVVLSGKVFFVLGYLLFATVLFVPFETWSRVTIGMINPFNVPPNVEWGLIGAIVGFAGIGGMGNILASNFVREKGWGMGSKVGAIASAFGDTKITLSHIGTICRPTPEAVARFNEWWKIVKRDQFGLWAWGSVIGMLLPCLLGAHYLKGDYSKEKQWYAAAALALDFGAVKGEIFTVMTLVCGIVILVPGAFSSMDGIARRWCDAFWSGSRRLRNQKPDKAKYVYYSFIAAYVGTGIFLNSFNISAPKMLMLNANLANLAITFCILHTLYVNCRFLPPEFRPGMGKRIAMGFAAFFYTCIFALMMSQTIPKILSGELFK